LWGFVPVLVNQAAAARSEPPRRIAFSHAFSELLVVKSVRAYADRLEPIRAIAA
jgi:hypothetical protein